jgi:ATP-dependent DNA helicase RecG
MLTLAGLLMLGRWPAIHEAAPDYFVDYQERPADGEEYGDTRWLDRVVPDGTWSGNLFDFYRRVVRKLLT